MNLVTAGRKLTLLLYLVYYIILCIAVHAGSKQVRYHLGKYFIFLTKRKNVDIYACI